MGATRRASKVEMIGFTLRQKLKFRMSFRSGSEWVADIKYMKVSNKLAVVTVEGSIYFYSFSPVVDFVTISGRITGQRLHHGTPFCLEYVSSVADRGMILLPGRALNLRLLQILRHPSRERGAADW